MSKRRKHERFRVVRGGFAALFRTGEMPIAGRIVDISPRGLGLNYLVDLGEIGDGRFNLHMFGSGERFFHLDRIKCRIVHNSMIPEQSWGKLVSWRCGVAFEEIEEAALAELKDFILVFCDDPDGRVGTQESLD